MISLEPQYVHFRIPHTVLRHYAYQVYSTVHILSQFATQPTLETVSRNLWMQSQLTVIYVVIVILLISFVCPSIESQRMVDVFPNTLYDNPYRTHSLISILDSILPFARMIAIPWLLVREIVTILWARLESLYRGSRNGVVNYKYVASQLITSSETLLPSPPRFTLFRAFEQV